MNYHHRPIWAFFTACILPVVSTASIITVPAEYPTIGAAIEAADYKDTIRVAPGVYAENLEFSGKSIRLISTSGPDVTVIRSPVSDKDFPRPTVPSAVPLAGDFSPESPADKVLPVPPVVSIGFGGDSTTLIDGFTIDGQGITVGVDCRLASPEIRNCIIENCYGAGDGGGMIVAMSAARVHDNVIRNNEAYWSGGGLYIGPTGGLTPRITDNRFYGNYACFGAAILAFNVSTLDITGNLVVHNYIQSHCVDDGAIIVYIADTARIVNNTICDNVTGCQMLEVSFVEIRNNIIGNNTRYGVRIDYAQAADSIIACDYNDVWGNGSDYYSFAQPGLHDISEDPLFDSANVDRYFLTAGSLCIDAGDPDPAYNDPDGSRNDMGAFPYGETVPHTPVTRQVPAEYGTIQAAVDASGDGDTILVAPGTYVGYVEFCGKSLQLVSAGGPEVTILKAPPDNEKLALPIISIGRGSDSTTVVSGFTIDGGGRTQGITVISSNPEISNCIIQYCDNSYDGGGIYVLEGAPRILDNIVRYNHAPSTGAGIFINLPSSGDTTIIRGNVVHDNYGYNSSGIALLTGINAIVERNIVYRNDCYESSIAKGAVYTWSASHVTIVNNTIDANLRGITVLASSYQTIHNNLVSNNAFGGIEINDTIGSCNYIDCDYNLVWSSGGYPYIDIAQPGPNDLALDPGLMPCYRLDEHYLAGTSPCIDAGDPDPRYNDPDGSCSDIGAVPYTPVDPCPGPVTRHVPGEYAGIQAAIDAAGYGDTIMVAPGTYDEKLYFGGKSIVVVSEAGAAATRLSSGPDKDVDSVPWYWRHRSVNDTAVFASYSPPGAMAAPDAGEKAGRPPEAPMIFVDFGSDGTTTIAGFTIDGQDTAHGLFSRGVDLTIQDCIIEHGSAAYGGGLNFEYASPVVTGNTIRNNYTRYFGGGMCLVLKKGPRTARIQDNIICENEANYANGLCIVQGGHALVSRNIIFNNLTLYLSGNVRSGLYLYACDDVRVVNNTIDANTYGLLTWNPGVIYLENNIISNNLEGGWEERDDAKTGRYVEHRYNDIWNNSANDYAGWAYPAETDLSVDPRFVPDYPGAYLLSEGSPCIDAGVPEPEYNDPDGSRSDIGAVPYQAVAPYEPKTILVPGDYAAIQAAVDAAVYGDTVLVAPGTYVETVDFGGKSLRLQSASGPAVTVIRTPDEAVKSGDATDGESFSRAYPAHAGAVVTMGPQGDSTTALAGFTIDGNNAMSGVVCRQVDADIGDCIIVNCSGGGREAAGIYFESGGPVIHDNVISLVDGWGDGAIYGRLGYGHRTAVIRDNHVHANWSFEEPGIALVHGDAARVEGNIISGSIGAYGTGYGLLLNDILSVDVVNNTITGNVTGIYCDSVGKVNLFNNIITGNQAYGISLRNKLDTVVAQYNNVWGNAGHDYNGPVYPDSTNLSQDPLFHPYHNGQFYLSASSPCVDAGHPDPAYNDPDGSRNDIGAKPYQDLPEPAPVTRRVPAEYATIREAIDAAGYGDTVLVAPGRYAGRISLAGKSIKLIAEGGAEETVLQAHPSDAPLVLEAYQDAQASSDKNIEVWWDTVAVVMIPPGSDSTTLISGFTIDGGGLFKGILCMNADVEIAHCTIEYCYGIYGAGLAIYACAPDVHDNIIRYCVSGYSGLGAAIYKESNNYDAPARMTRIRGNVITWNLGMWPGICLRSAEDVVIERNIINANCASPIYPQTETRKLGSVYLWDCSDVSITNNTIDRNTLGIGISNNTGGTRIWNNIISHNLEGGVKSDQYYSADYNLYWENDKGNRLGQITYGEHDLCLDPIFDPVSAGAYHLSAGSPAVDAGDPGAQYNDPDGSRNDIGAVPYLPTPPHTPVTRQVPSEYMTIQAAVDAAGYGDTILVTPGLYEENVDLRGKSLVLLSEAGAAATIIRGHELEALAEIMHVVPSNHAYDEGVDDDYFRMTSACVVRLAAPGENIVIDGFTIDGADQVRGIVCLGTGPAIRNSIIENGTDHYRGGGVFFSGGAPQIEDNVIRNNFARAGGGVCGRLGKFNGSARISRNRFLENSGYQGYAVYLAGLMYASVDHNIMYGNRILSGIEWIFGQDGTVYLMADKIDIHNNTIVGNEDGIVVTDADGVDIRNNIIALNNTAGVNLSDQHGPITNIYVDYNDVWGNALTDYDGQSQPGGHDISADPLFDPTDPMGFRLSPDSPCRDAGDPDTLYDDPDGSRGDIGALPNTVAITRHVPADHASVQEAIDHAGYGDTIEIAAGTYREYLYLNGKSLILCSQAGPGSTVIRGSYVKDGSRLFEYVVAVGETRTDGTVISGLTIDGGNEDMGIYCNRADITVRDCVIENCTYPVTGAAMTFIRSAPLVVDNVIRHNVSTGNAEGIVYFENAAAAGTITIRNNIIYGNSADQKCAGLALVGCNPALIERNVIYGNTIAPGETSQGCLYIGADSAALYNNTIDNNSLGICVDTVAAVDIRNNIIVNNADGGLLCIEGSVPLPGRVADYNDVWNNGGGNYLGDAVPGDNDLSADPVFRMGQYLLAETSPCIDAGDPDPAFNDPDGSRNDMGAYPYSGILCGEANGDGQVNVGDAVFLINYIFKNGPSPDPVCIGDANGDGQVNVGDTVYLINYIFKNGPGPVADCCL